MNTQGKVLTGIGWVYLGDGKYLDDYATFKITFGNKIFDYPMSSSFGKTTINVSRDLSGEIEFRKLTAEVLHLLVGGNLVNGNAIKHNNEVFTVDSSSPYTATLENAPIVDSGSNSLRVYSKDANDNVVYWEQVASGSEEAGKFSISGDTLTFSVDDAGKSLYADYFYESTDEAKKIVLGGGSDSLPSSFSLNGLLIAQTDSGEVKTIHIAAKNCKVSSAIDLGGAVQSVGSVKASFSISTQDAGDLVLTLED